MMSHTPSTEESTSNPFFPISKLRKTTQCSIVVSVLLIEILLGHFFVTPLFEFGSRYSVGFDFVGLCLFALYGTAIIWLLFLKWKKRIILLIILISLYIFSYALLSFNGEYYFSRSGRTRWNGMGLSIYDQHIWEPRFLRWQRFVNIHGDDTSRGSYLGHFFSPLVQIDRAWIHKTENMFLEKKQ